MPALPKFVIHQRMGKIRHLGRGISFFKLPWIDRYTIIPSSTRTIQFKADQITAENQGGAYGIDKERAKRSSPDVGNQSV